MKLDVSGRAPILAGGVVQRGDLFDAVPEDVTAFAVLEHDADPEATCRSVTRLERRADRS